MYYEKERFLFFAWHSYYILFYKFLISQDSHSRLIKKRIDVDLSFSFSDISRELDFNPICLAVGVKK